MRKRFVLLWTVVVLVLALMVPATTAAATFGRIASTNTYCTGANTVHATFKLTKYSGFYATKLSMTIKGQGYYGGRWHTELNIGTYSARANTYGGYYFKDSFYFYPGHSGKHRILATGKIWNGGHLVASGSTHSLSCS